MGPKEVTSFLSFSRENQQAHPLFFNKKQPQKGALTHGNLRTICRKSSAVPREMSSNETAPAVPEREVLTQGGDGQEAIPEKRQNSTRVSGKVNDPVLEAKKTDVSENTAIATAEAKRINAEESKNPSEIESKVGMEEAKAAASNTSGVQESDRSKGGRGTPDSQNKAPINSTASIMNANQNRPPAPERSVRQNSTQASSEILDNADTNVSDASNSSKSAPGNVSQAVVPQNATQESMPASLNATQGLAPLNATQDMQPSANLTTNTQAASNSQVNNITGQALPSDQNATRSMSAHVNASADMAINNVTASRGAMLSQGNTTRNSSEPELNRTYPTEKNNMTQGVVAEQKLNTRSSADQTANLSAVSPASEQVSANNRSTISAAENAPLPDQNATDSAKSLSPAAMGPTNQTSPDRNNKSSNSIAAAAQNSSSHPAHGNDSEATLNVTQTAPVAGKAQVPEAIPEASNRAVNVGLGGPSIRRAGPHINISSLFFH